jgi:UDP-N-acetylmuramyl tripeptide synthase
LIIAGIFGKLGKAGTVSLIESLLSSSGEKYSVTDTKKLSVLELPQIKYYTEELRKNNTDVLLIKINPLEISENILKGLNFDIILCSDKADDFNRTEFNRYRQLLEHKGLQCSKKPVVIVNGDDMSVSRLLEGYEYYTVTYGYNSRASVTASSVGDNLSENGFICCTQRGICSIRGGVVEPQEFKMDIERESNNSHNILAAAAFAVVIGMKPVCGESQLEEIN